MKGYHVWNGFMGWVKGKGYQLFESEDAYYDWKWDAYPILFSNTAETVCARQSPQEDLTCLK